jgi:hypothetical protein
MSHKGKEKKVPIAMSHTPRNGKKNKFIMSLHYEDRKIQMQDFCMQIVNLG